MHKLGRRYKDKEFSKIRKLGNDLVSTYNKRTLSCKPKEQDIIEIARACNIQNTESKHLISNISPNYTELNKLAMNKIMLSSSDTKTSNFIDTKILINLYFRFREQDI